MSNKFFDVVPPQKEVEKTKSFSQEPERKNEKKGRKRSLKGVFLVIILILLMTGTALFFLRSAEVTIYPQITDLNLQEEVVVDSSKEKADFVAKVIPGEEIQAQKSSSKEFSATGRVSREQKAAGVIRVYNAYSTSPQVLVASTRFVSADGMLFRSVKREVISGGRYEGGEFVPGHTDIEVRAAEAGESYNIEPTTFSIPGFAGTPRYTDFYGRSFQPMEGGYVGEAAQVVQEDLEKAKEEVLLQARKESGDSLRESLSEDFEILEGSIKQEVLSENASAEAGDATETFSYETEVRTTGLAVRKSDLQEFVSNLVNMSVPEKKKVKEGSSQFNYSLIEEDGEQVTLKIEVQAEAYYDVDLVAVRKFLSGQSLQEAKIVLDDQPGIERAELELNPFWRRKFPDNPEEINAEIRL